MKVLGIDSATRNFGFCVLEKDNDTFKLIHSETFKTVGSVFKDQLDQTYNRVNYLYIKYDVDLLVIEEPVGSSSISAQMNRIIGSLYLISNVVLFKPSTVKLIVTGYGKASKDDIDFSVKEHLKLSKDFKFSSNHASDSAAVALTFFLKNGVNTL